VAVLDFPWSEGSCLRGMMESIIPLPRRERRELAPALSPRMPGQRRGPGWEGQKGRPGESECPKLSR
jgi:hypothetical protein